MIYNLNEHKSEVTEAAIVHFPSLTIKGDFFFSYREKTHLNFSKGIPSKKKEISITCTVLSYIVLLICIVHACCKASVRNISIYLRASLNSTWQKRFIAEQRIWTPCK